MEKIEAHKLEPGDFREMAENLLREYSLSRAELGDVLDAALSPVLGDDPVNQASEYGTLLGKLAVLHSMRRIGDDGRLRAWLQEQIGRISLGVFSKLAGVEEGRIAAFLNGAGALSSEEKYHLAILDRLLDQIATRF